MIAAPPRRHSPARCRSLAGFHWLALAGFLVGVGLPAASGDQPSFDVDEDTLLERFSDHCYECHAYGEAEGGFSFETLGEGGYGDRTRAKWEAIWKNIRSETMPPSSANERPDETTRVGWLDWIQEDVFCLSADNIDPGQVVLRRLNRNEYRRTIKDLTNIDLDVADLLPADNTGYGFDTIGEVLTLSPVVLERYIEAASTVVDQWIPREGPAAPIQDLHAWQWRTEHLKGPILKGTWSVKGTRRIIHPVKAPQSGPYELVLRWTMENAWVRTAQTADVLVYRVDYPDKASTPIEKLIEGQQPILRTELKFNDNKAFTRTETIDLESGKHALVIEVIETNDDVRGPSDDQEDSRYSFYPNGARLVGPFLPDSVEYPANARRLLTNGPPRSGETDAELSARAREVLEPFSLRAFRRPCDPQTLDRLCDLVVSVGAQPGKRYEDGIAEAIKLILVSPRFLYRGEVPRQQDNPDADPLAVPIDDYSLATRLSFLLWGTTPDSKLLELAADGKLHESLDDQITRLLEEDWRIESGLGDFLGQWLRIRDVQNWNIDARAVLRTRSNKTAGKVFHWRVRQAMEDETEAMFRHLVTDNEPVERLLNARYTFLNETLAEFYGIPGVKGRKMRRVDYPEDSHRRGILSHGSVLMVTSNPTRTSPVKRGLFVLENLLGVPSPPAPPDVPSLESSAKGELENASLRAILEQHRSDSACASCHARMDPLGLALENFNAIGQYREEDFPPTESWWRHLDADPVAIDSSGTLMTGESFTSIEELADILANQRRKDFYRCLTEKWMTYALGRGLTYRDATAINQIVDQVQRDGGGAQTLLRAIIHSKPFTHMRRPDPIGSDALAQSPRPVR